MPQLFSSMARTVIWALHTAKKSSCVWVSLPSTTHIQACMLGEASSNLCYGGFGSVGLLLTPFYLHDCPIFIFRACLPIWAILYYRMSCSFIYRDLVQQTLPIPCPKLVILWMDTFYGQNSKEVKSSGSGVRLHAFEFGLSHLIT